MKEKNSTAAVGAIIERNKDDGLEVLLQTRWKKGDKYHGFIEIPAGRLRAGEDVISGLEREVKEETGLKITKIKPEINLRRKNKYGDIGHAFVPFCGTTYSGFPVVGFVFVCEAEGELVKKGLYDAKDARWVKFAELKKIVNENPDSIMPCYIPVLEYYIKQKSEGKI
ncbi:MAG: NUDIX hydrolase [Candidatus Parvarchaeota archaeon]|nr:NUDIX hydrolase [Candidatus Jingweiarchaeum tengchongense]MCW1298568.1 NUDIX hydrolase [Candidatus Jingweiarchaeum tengchongense]MCW1304591.1 NUDIX hydrolase [Candidatus Jingweiarchaeum tengchongense]MCW1309172.1 NUDIX hydrolase [Candidatus Jingweiarchaeum tengchongense]MCW1310263.1 NUDIX hydrolase [Candidatus Jingweiarchaeum tengchongense]